jgi:hypothetical protein
MFDFVQKAWLISDRVGEKGENNPHENPSFLPIGITTFLRNLIRPGGNVATRFDRESQRRRLQLGRQQILNSLAFFVALKDDRRRGKSTSRLPTQLC